MARASWTRENLRHAASLLRYGRNPAATVYESIGTDFFLALAPGWLNMGLWEGDGSDPEEGPIAVRRLVERLASDLPPGGDILDVGCGLGAQEPVIADATKPRCLVAVNITLSQLRAGREQLARAAAAPLVADAIRLPLASGAFDGVISVEAAFHFRSRARFFHEAHRVLRPGGVLTMSDVPVVRRPRRVRELVAALSQLRVWGLGVSAAETTAAIEGHAASAGFVDVRAALVGERVIGPALRFVRNRLRRSRGEVPRAYELAARAMVSQVELLWDRRMIDYLMLTARRPGGPAPGLA